MNAYLSFFSTQTALLVRLTVGHILLSVVAVVVALVIALPLGVAACGGGGNKNTNGGSSAGPAGATAGATQATTAVSAPSRARSVVEGGAPAAGATPPTAVDRTIG